MSAAISALIVNAINSIETLTDDRSLGESAMTDHACIRFPLPDGPW
ncbi:MAG: hypothetical protein ACLRPV_17020 [Lacrimispora saccharolytica]